MELLLILCGVFLALGLFFVAADLFKLPRLATQKALLSAGRQEKKQARTTDVLLMGWAVKLAPHIHMDEYKHSRLKNTLNAAGLGMTPEEYTAFAAVKAAAVMLGILPCLLLFPLLALVVILLAVMVYFKEIRRADEKLSGKRDEIESELPRFVATITQELANSRDVLSMVEHYKQNAGATFAAELDILTADMRSGSYEAALTRFEARFNSPLLSDVVRGLIGVLRGDDGVHYFQMLAHDMKQLELQRLKAKAMKIPPKIRVFSFILLMCFLVTYLAIIIFQILNSLMAGDFEESLDYGDIYGRLDSLLNLRSHGGYHVQYTEDGKMEFRVWNLSVDLRNASFASADSAGNRLVADCEIELEVPVSFGGRLLPPMRMTVKVSAGYTPRF